MARDAVPAFFLYGEPVREADARFLHVESIDVRSRAADWTIRAHAHRDLNHVMFVTTGGGEMQADASTWSFAAPAVLVCTAGTIHGFEWRPPSDGYVLTIAEAYLRELAVRWPDCGVLFDGARVLSMSEDDFAVHDFAPALERLGRELVWSAPGRSMAIEGYLSTILAGLLRVSAASGPARAVSPRAALVARFREEVERRFRSGAGLSGYAEALGVTESRLRAACLRVAGASPMTLVRDRIMVEAKRMLLYSDLSVAQTAWELGFEDAAYFSRFFTAREGRSPSAFRALGARGEAG